MDINNLLPLLFYVTISVTKYVFQSDPFLWFWEPSVDDLKIFDIDRTVENNPKYPQPSATVLVSMVPG